MPNWIDQSVPTPGGAVDPQKQAMLDMLMGDDQEDALRAQATVDQLREYGGGATPQMRGGVAPRPIEYAGTVMNRLASMYGQRENRDASGSALEALRRALYPDGAPGGGSYQGMDTADYGGGL